ncbi:hypothetical protein ABS755_08075 [Castellaniella sp. FW104-16D08]|uniref:virion core protein, T7 gp14 family n=1 Tax=unclassified Castellaniella TaxID=2617606 RepID=UPI003314ECCD
MSGASSMAAIGVGMSVVGTVGSMAASRQAAEAQQRQLQQQANSYAYQAQVSRNNAMVAEWQARSALQAGAKAEQTQRLKAASLTGAQRARLAANGVDLGQGNALNILMDTDYMNERDVQTIKDNAALKAWGYRVDGRNSMDNAGMLDAGAFNAVDAAGAINPTAAAGSTMLSGLGQVASSWYRYSQGFKPATQTGFTNAGGGSTLTPFDVSSRF